MNESPEYCSVVVEQTYKLCSQMWLHLVRKCCVLMGLAVSHLFVASVYGVDERIGQLQDHTLLHRVM